MALDTIVRGSTSGTGVEVNAANQLKVVPEVDATANPGNIGGVRFFSENDQGVVSGVPSLYSPEADVDYRLRVSQDIILDEVVFNYTAQDTGKHTYTTSTLANTWTAGQLTTNSGSITTTTTGTVFATYATFPNIGTQTLSADIEAAFSAQPTTNSFIEFGLGIPGAATAAPSDGVFFRLNSAGLSGVASNNGTETSIAFPLSGGSGVWAYTNNKRYQFIVYMSTIQAVFWVNDGTGAVKLGAINLPTAQGRMCMAQGMQFFIKHRITGGAAGGVLQGLFGAYNVRSGGANISSDLGAQGSRVYGSYQGLSGGTQGSLANYANNTNPTAQVPTNTTAALGTGLGGQFWETVSLAVNTDGIICSYQVPAITVNVPGRRLKINGIALSSYVQTVIAGGPYVAQYSIAFGHTAVSMATAEAGTTKAPRRIPLPFNQVVTTAQAVSTIVSQPLHYMAFRNPIYVNPGEFVALVTKHVGTAGTTGTVAHVVTFDYGWE